MIRKFRSIEEMNAAQRPKVEVDPERLFNRLSALFDFVASCGHPTFRGVHKFRTMEESNEFRKSWLRERIIGLQPGVGNRDSTTPS